MTPSWSKAASWILCCAWVGGALGVGCGRFNFEQIDAAHSGMDAGDAQVDGAQVDATNDATPGPDATIDAGVDSGVPEIHVIPNETLLDTGALHTCAGLFGRVYCWGDNERGQLGDGTTQDRSAPVQLSTLSQVVDLQLGEFHSCALTRIGAVYCWGANDMRQLGDGTTQDRRRPTVVTGFEQGAQTLWVGPFHACARAADDQIRCWGRNDHGQLGDGTTTTRNAPVAMTDASNVVSLVLGADMTCAVNTSRTVTCRGRNHVGQLGNGTSSANDGLSPVAVSGITNVQHAAAGHHHVCVALDNGQARCWGQNARFQCGNDSTNATEPTAVAVALLDATRSGAAAEHTSCMIDETGVAKCWGGDVATSTTDRRVPTAVPGVAGVREVHAGRAHQCMRVVSNYVHCVGDNTEGQLGDGTRQSTATAVQVLGLPAPVSGPTPECGDRFLGNSETCDDGTETARCNADCTLSQCGDGVLNPSAGETCETNGDLDAGGCLPDCTLP